MFLTSQPPDITWERLKSKNENIIHCLSSIYDQEELIKAGVEDAYHFVILNQLDPTSNQ
jgi:hypothetical protein